MNNKTHLDLRFTDYSENIKQKYIIRYFIPDAVDLDVQLHIKKNTPDLI